MSQLGLYNYWIVIVLMMIGLYAVIARGHLVKKLMGLGMFQSAVIMMYVSLGKVAGGTAPIVMGDLHGGHGDGHGDDGHGAHGEAAHGAHGEAAHGAHGEAVAHGEAAAHGVQEAVAHGVQEAVVLYSNPLPHVLMLTAIVVGVATLAVGLALSVRIYEAYGTLEEEEIAQKDHALGMRG